MNQSFIHPFKPPTQMAQIFIANVYQINDAALAAPESRGFAPGNVNLRPAPAGMVVGGITMNGIIEERPSGLRVNGINHYVAQTVAQLQTLANA